MPVMNVDQATGLCGGFDVSQRHEAAGRREPRQVRHDAFLHVLREQLRIHAVDAEDHHARRRVRAGGCAAGVEDCSEQGENARARCRLRHAAAGACTGRTRPVMCAGLPTPNIARIVGARSWICGSAFGHAPVREQHAGHQARIDAVVAAPRLGVVGEHFVGDAADRAFPRRAVAAVVADDQVRAVAAVRSVGVNLRRIEHVVDRSLVGLADRAGRSGPR